MFENIAGTIEQSIARGARSKYLVEEGTTMVGGIRQVFKKGDATVVKHYRPSKGTIDIACFRGDKAKLLEQDGYYEHITQPDKLFTQLWSNSPFVEHSLSITKPLEQPNLAELVKGIHKAQQTTSLSAYNIDGRINYDISSYPTRICSGNWGTGVERI